MSNPWFKFYASDYLKEVKFKGVDANRRSCFLTLLCYANDDGGRVNTKYLTNDLLKIESGVEMGGEVWEKTGNVYEWLAERDFGYSEGDYFILKTWEKRQESNLSDAERSKNYRNRHATVTRHVTNVTLEENRIEENRIDSSAVAPIPVFERKIREKEQEYRDLVEDLLSKDYLSATKLHKIITDEFLPHWLERSEGAKKARWERERVFDYRRRVRTWITKFHEYAKDYRCVEGFWHRKGESCYHVKDEKPTGHLNPAHLDAVRSLAASKTI